MRSCGSGGIGKTAREENFPVGSWLLAADRRGHVATFYRFARAADDIADDCRLSADEKLVRLRTFEAVLDGAMGDDDDRHPARAMRSSLAATGVDARHCRDLLAAFRQDAVQSRYETWPDLLAYCDRSAAPVGRYLLELHGEGSAAIPAADALCNGLQILNHLQDCGGDYRSLDRVYLPLAWLRAAGCEPADLGSGRLGGRLRSVLDRCLAGIDELLHAAAPLPSLIRSRRLAAEADVILRLAAVLARELRLRDPLA